MTPRFLNVDLKIECATRLDLLIAEMGKRVFLVYSGPASKARRHPLSVEISGAYKSPDTTIHALCKVVEGLSADARSLWSAAIKTFDVGYEITPSVRSSQVTLRPHTIDRVAKLGAALAVSYYLKGRVKLKTVDEVED